MPIKRLAKKVRDRLFGVRKFKIPADIKTRFTENSSPSEFDAVLRSHYFSSPELYAGPDYLASSEGKGDLAAHISGRLQDFRSRAIPWIIDAAGPLKGKHILEIGCGTGSSTVAMAEQGALVTGVEPHSGSLAVAQKRISHHGLDSDFIEGNADQALALSGSFDIIALFAVIEHMTWSERRRALRQAWARLGPGGHLIIAEAPNRLWYFDDHTSQEHFFMWLPDEIAVAFSERTPRPRFNSHFRATDTTDPEAMVRFARWGRGVSYHDFALALEVEPERIPVISALELYIRKMTRSDLAFRHTPWRRYEHLIHGMRPDIHPGFFTQYLDIILHKPL